ncbi:MAG: hypothetical protein A2Y12_05725 [Planctomycetes bacterium GWF2_42_9]|nr:MAG: hypothetical protein A2Y12_05725 [Planctomycetes bacterium GWF2_42_9]
MKNLLFLCVIFVYVTDVKGVDDRQTVYKSDSFVIYPDSVVRGSLMATVVDEKIISNGTDKGPENVTWTPMNDLSDMPEFKSEYPIFNAVFRMAIDDYIKNIDPQTGVLNASAGRPPWVRDTGYVAILSSSILFPKLTKDSLEYNIHTGGTIDPEQIHDVYFGITYEMSDFVILIPAVWEYVKVTGDIDFLKLHYDDMDRSIQLATDKLFDTEKNLYGGGATFNDGPNGYPDRITGHASLMSTCTNAIHYEANKVMAEMAAVLKKPKKEQEKYLRRAYLLKDNINEKLWIESRNWYSQLLIGGSERATERASALGQILPILFGVASKEKIEKLLNTAPDTEWGIPTIYPYYGNRWPFHDSTVWHFVEGLWSITNARMGNEERLMKGLCVLAQSAALKLTFKEYMILPDGLSAGKDYQLWSAAGYAGAIMKGLFGFRFFPTGLWVHPSVPAKFSSGVSLNNIHYRDAVFDIEVIGSGCNIKSFLLDGKPAINFIPSHIKGRHSIKVVMSDDKLIEVDCPDYVVSGKKAILNINVKSSDLKPSLLTKTKISEGFNDNCKFQKDKQKYIFEISAEDSKDYALSGLDFVVVLKNNNNEVVNIGSLSRLDIRPGHEIEFEPSRLHTVRPMYPGKQILAELKLKNNTKKKSNLKIKWNVPEGLILKKHDKSIVCLPSSVTKTIAIFECRTNLDYGKYVIPVTVLANNSEEVKSKFVVDISDTIDLRGLWMMAQPTENEHLDTEFIDKHTTERGHFVELPGFWERIEEFSYWWFVQEKYKDYDGRMWFRKHVLVPYDWEGHDLMLRLHKIADDDITYFNGVKVGETKGVGNERLYRIPASLVRKGENNCIIVDVTDNGGQGGIVGWPIEISVLP